ncbi:MAG: caspase family protein [Bacteroidetes bacterium]|nr:caspase family protein [Bacteroidota bacterium]
MGHMSNIRLLATSKKDMRIDRRFAIVIGINDYEIKPLDFCVNDADSVADILEQKCYFKKDDIYKITSDKDNPIKDISGHLESALIEIEKHLIPNEDSIFFFFAGHGEYHFEKSGLQFHDSLTEIGHIFEKINSLKPKYQCYVIDACESGGKVLTRGANKESDLISNYIDKSTGILFMYAATEKETAKEYEKIKHGLFTHYFLDAINKTEIYDEEGILTPNRIQDYIAKETSKESKFKQTPVIENRTIGYYPFAFKSAEKKEEKENTRVSKSDKIEKSNNTIQKEYFPEVPSEIRKEIFDQLKPELDTLITNHLEEFDYGKYELSSGNDFGVFQSDVEDKLTEEIVKKSVSEKVVSLNNAFSSERELIKPNPILGGMGMITALLNQNKPEYRYYNHINWNENVVLGKSINLNSSDINVVSSGVSVIIYQALYGLGVAFSSFYLDYNGYSNNTLKGPFIEIKAYKVHQNTVSNIIEDIKSQLLNFDSMTIKWNENRKSAIEDFERKAK